MRQQSDRWNFWASCILALGVVSLCGATARADEWAANLSRLPERPNALALINLGSLRAKAKVGNEDYVAQARQVAQELDLEFNPDIRFLSVAAKLDLGSLHPTWELGVVNTDHPVPIADINSVEQGYIDTIAGRRMVFSPRGMYIMPIESPGFVVVRPADRQLVTRWLQTDRSFKGQGIGDFLEQCEQVATRDHSPIVMGLDFRGAFSPAGIKDRLQRNSSVELVKVNLDQLSEVIASIEGLIFAVRVKDGVLGKIRIDFGVSPKILESTGKKMLMEALARHGVYAEDLDSWTSEIDGNSWSLSGPISPSGLVNVLNLLRLPAQARGIHEAVSTRGASLGKSETAIKAAATKSFFSNVQKSLKQVRNYRAATAGAKASFNERMARNIDDQPLLNVDEDMLEYGSQISALLRGAAVTIRDANMEAGRQKAGATRVYTNYTAYGYSQYNTSNPAIAQADRAATTKGMAAHIKNMEEIDRLTIDIRKRMTERYQVEF